MRRTVPLVITFVAGTAMIITFFFPRGWAIAEASTKIKNWGIILGAFAVVLGASNIIQIAWQKFMRNEDRFYKLVLLIGLFGMLGLGFVCGDNPKTSHTWSVSAGHANPFYWVFENIQFPLTATMFSLLVFYITSAAYRAFRIRSVEAGLLLFTAVIVMLGQIPIMSALDFDIGLEWIMRVPNVAASRAIMIGAAMGVAAMSLRIILGIERSYLGGD